MEVILLGIYAFFVWLIFIKLKLLPWTTPWKVGVVITPVVALVTMILLLNIVAPSVHDRVCRPSRSDKGRTSAYGMLGPAD